MTTQQERDRQHREDMRNSQAHTICQGALNENYMRTLNNWMKRDHLPTFGGVDEVIRAAYEYIKKYGQPV
jgi:hypothetical protein